MADTDLADWVNDVPKDAPTSAPSPDAHSLAPWVAEANPPPQRTAPAHKPERGWAPPAPAAKPQAGAPPPPEAAPEPSWGEVGQRAWQNLPSSAMGAGQAMWHAVRHAPETIHSIGQLGAGLASQASGALGVQLDPQHKAQTEALAKALEQHYAQSYGSIKGFKNALATDPVSVATDAATVLGGGEAALGKIAGLEKAASIAGKVGSAIDPVANAVRVAKIAAKPVVGVARAVSSRATGVPSSLLKVAAEAGKTADPALRSAFLKSYTGQGDSAEYLNTAQSAIGQLRQDASDAYLAKKATLSTANPSFAPIDDALAKARASTMAGGVNVGQFKAANDALDQAEAMVNGWKAAPDPAYQSLLGFDNLKQAIWDLRDSTSNSAAQQHLGGVYNGVKQAIVDTDPEYAKLMEQYQLGRNNILDAQKTLVGAGKTPAATAAMAKGLRALKTGTGKNLFAQLAEKEPTLPYMLAGHALSPWGASGLLPGLAERLAPFGAMGLGAAAHSWPIGLGALAGQAIAQSPKIAGAANLALGLGERVAQPLAKADYYAGRVGQEGAEPPAETAPPPPAVANTSDPVWGAMLQRESGAQQFRPNGKPVTSWKGALGIAQMMPGTGPEAAQMAGLEWDPARLANDPDYNQKVGHAYYEMLLDMFGDPIKAAAAYNGGPKAVMNAVEAAHKAHDDWTAHLKPETRDYVTYVSQHSIRTARAAGGRVDQTRRDEIVGKLLKAAESAKRTGNAATKPMLAVPDDAVAKALAVAQRAI